jgi:hypothetical protein
MLRLKLLRGKKTMCSQEKYNAKFGEFPPEPNGLHDILSIVDLLEKLSEMALKRDRPLTQEEVDKAIGFDSRLNKPTIKF